MIVQQRLGITTYCLVLPRDVYNIARGLTSLATHLMRIAHEGLTADCPHIWFSVSFSKRDFSQHLLYQHYLFSSP